MGSRAEAASSNSLELSKQKTKNRSKSSADKIPSGNEGRDDLPSDFLRGSLKPEQPPSTRNSGSEPSARSASNVAKPVKTSASQVAPKNNRSQSTLADFDQTAPAVATLAKMSSKESPAEVKKTPVGLSDYLQMNFGRRGNSAGRLLDAGSASPPQVKKPKYSIMSTPSPPPRGGNATPLRDEVTEDFPGIPRYYQSEFDFGSAYQQPRNEYNAQLEPRGRRMHPQVLDRAGEAPPVEGSQSFQQFRGIPQGFDRPFAEVLGGRPWFTSGTSQDHIPGMAGMGQPQPYRPDLSPVLSMFNKMIDKMGGSSMDKSNNDPPELEKDSSDESEDEQEKYSTYAGQPLLAKSRHMTVTEEGCDAWRTLRGLDDAGIASGTYKKVTRKEKDINYYVKANRVFAPKERNLELPPLTGFKEVNEKKLVAKNKALGAIGAALVGAVDATRECAEDLMAAKDDFENGKFEDNQKEAVDVCLASSQWMNDKILSHLIKAFKMVSVESSLITLERRALTESEVGDEGMKKILSESPPDDEFLYGGAVKDSVQKARDASLLSRAFTRYKGHRATERPWYKKVPYRPKDARFKPRRFGKQKFGGVQNKDANFTKPHTFGRFKKKGQ